MIKMAKYDKNELWVVHYCSECHGIYDNYDEAKNSISDTDKKHDIIVSSFKDFLKEVHKVSICCNCFEGIK